MFRALLRPHFDTLLLVQFAAIPIIIFNCIGDVDTQWVEGPHPHFFASYGWPLEAVHRSWVATSGESQVDWLPPDDAELSVCWPMIAIDIIFCGSVLLGIAFLSERRLRKPPRERYQPHITTGVTILIAAAILVGINRYYIYYPSYYAESTIRTVSGDTTKVEYMKDRSSYICGWPLPFYRRIDRWGATYPKGTFSSRIGGNTFNWYLYRPSFCRFLNITIALLLLAAVGIVTERRIRRYRAPASEAPMRCRIIG